MVISLVKPRLKRDRYGWSCSGLGKEGCGRTPKAAYMDWLNEASLYPYI